VLVMGAWTGTVNVAAQIAFHHDDQIEIPPSVVFSDSGFVAPEADIAAHAEAGIEWYRRAGFIADGGWSPIPAHRAMLAVRRAWLLSVLGRFDDALVELDDTIGRIGMTEDLALGRSRLLRILAPQSLDVWFGEVLTLHPDWMRLRDERITWRLEQMTPGDAIAEARVAVAATPNELLALRRLAVLLVDHGGPDACRESAELTERTLEIEPGNPNAWRALALARAKSGDFEKAGIAMAEAVRLAPGDWRLRHQYAVLLNDLGRWDDADREVTEAIRLWELAGGEQAGTKPTLPPRPMGPMRE
jgi:tetratricopeptide (TPR) repeat protein